MSVFKRGNVWWFEFTFRGQRIRESTKSKSKQLAEKAERKRHTDLEEGSNNVRQKTDRYKLFSVAAKAWLTANESSWSTSNRRIEGYNVDHLLPHFGKKLLVDIAADDITEYQAARKRKGAGPRTINMEVGSLRAILRKARLWADLQPDVKMLAARGEVGRALSTDEQSRLFAACKASRSRSLYPAVQVSLHTGLRNAELRNLRWLNVDLIEGEITVGKSKTAAGEGRKVPLSDVALDCLKEWRSQFPDAQPAHYVFPSEKVGLNGEDGHQTGKLVSYDVDPTKPIGSWKVAWTTAREVAKVQCRWHDMRHSFISTLGESAEASDTEIMALAGHVSKKMLERYSHARNERKRAAIAAAFGRKSVEAQPEGQEPTTEAPSPQNPPQSIETEAVQVM
jgi:integrase